MSQFYFMKMNCKYILLLIMSLFFLGCGQHSKKNTTSNSNKVFANGMPEDNEIIMSSCRIIGKDKKNSIISFDDGKNFYKVSKSMFSRSHNIVDSLIKSERNSNVSHRPHSISDYFIQYVGYTEGNKHYVYVNLSTFITNQYLKSGLVLTQDLDNDLYLDKDAGYAGYIIIDIQNNNVLKYKFEDNIVE